MKEYLFKGIGGEYRVVYHDCKGRAIEIPDGAIKAYLNFSNTINFVNVDDDYMNGATNGEWVDTHRGKHESSGHIIVWQRHTQPEELPFVDDGLTDATAFIQSNMDQVNHPSHYASGSIECIDAIESSMTKQAFAGYLKGNVQKYMWRYENKGGVESLQKAQWYLNRLILLQSAHD